MDKDQLLGSQTAKNGFENERDIVEKFNNWKDDEEAKKWLVLMQYDLNEIELVEAMIIKGFKTDVQVQVRIKLKKAIDAQNIQVKLVSNTKSGFNQIDKRWVDKYAEMWNIPEDIVNILKLYTGETAPKISHPKDSRRMYLFEFSELEQSKLLDWFKNNKTLIVSDILKGRGSFAAEWMLVANKSKKDARWILKPMNFCVNFYGNGEVSFTKKGNLKIGQISMQRKGGDRGRSTAKMLQFKINPIALFNC